jgi:hypothetical protein
MQFVASAHVSRQTALVVIIYPRRRSAAVAVHCIWHGCNRNFQLSLYFSIYFRTHPAKVGGMSGRTISDHHSGLRDMGTNDNNIPHESHSYDLAMLPSDGTCAG